MLNGQAPAGNPQQAAAAQNAAIRRGLILGSILRKNKIYSGVLSAAQAAGTAALIINPQPVGLCTKFVIEISGTANNTDGANAALISDFGLGNLIGQLVFNDTQNNTRIQTSGWHLDQVFRAKHRWGADASLLSTALVSGSGVGNNFGVVVAPTNFAHGTSQAFRFVYEVPISYSDEDLRGAVYLGVVNATASLQITMNTAPFAAAGVDSTLACWKGAAGDISNVTVTIYQVYYDQLPMAQGGAPILPPLDMSTVYELKNTTNQQTFQAGQDNPLSYANFRRFYSTFYVYNHDPSADAGRVGGTDANYFSLQSANFTNIWKIDPLEVARQSRIITQTDFPLGMYYFSFRKKPVSTISYGNMQLILNPITAAAGAYALVGWEDFATVNALTQAGSLAG